MLLSGCLGTRYLKPNEQLLFKQKTQIPKSFDIDALEELYVQSPNRQFPIIPLSPYVWFYQKGIKNYDKEALGLEKEDLRSYYDSLITHAKSTKKKNKLTQKRNRKSQKIDKKIKEGNVLMRWGEPLALYDSQATASNKLKIQQYLFSKGYFDSKITHKTSNTAKLLTSTYEVSEGQPYIIDTVISKIGDNTVEQLLNLRKSKIKTSENYSQTNLTNERDAINDYLKNNGYYNFSREYISFDIDTAHQDHGVAVRTVIKNPLSEQKHHQFTIDSINFVVNESTTNSSDSLSFRRNYQNIEYSAYDAFYKPKVLNRRVFLHQGDLYSKQNTFDTQRQLANLDVFKFININYDSTGGRFIANIFTQPLPRYQWTNEFGVNVSQGIPGPFYNTTFKKRNIFRGLENFELSGRLGVEVSASATDLDDPFNFEAGINAALIFPKFILPIKNLKREKLGYLNPKTKLSIGYSLTDRPEYSRKNANFRTTYSWGKQLNTSYNFSLADVSIIDSEIDSIFNNRLIELRNNGSNLIRSFQPSFVSSMSFFVIKNFNNYGLGKHNSSYIQLFTESGGTTQNFISTQPLEDQGLETYKFLKFNIDYRKVSQLTKRAGVAFRVNAGIAIPYGDNEVLPYEKYFFAGGSKGIRGWRPRRLGPGSYNHIDVNSGEVSYQIEQPGEILIQASIEFRRNLFGFVDWAYFVDVGNIWTINEDKTRPGAQFSSERFLKEFAVASGLGLRFDFVFLIIRFDAGMKIHDPARPEGKRFIFSDGFNDAPFDINDKTEPVIFNIGIGYPF
jgi:outer membrane protein assembly factor BamA